MSQQPKLTARQLDVLQKRTNLDKQEIEQWYQAFIDAYPAGIFREEMYLNRFRQILGNVASEEYLRFCFRGMDKNRDKYVDFPEFLVSAVIHSSGTWEQQLEDIFDVCVTSDHNKLNATDLGNYLAAKALYFGEGEPNCEATARQNAELIIKKIAKPGETQITKTEFLTACKNDQKTFEEFFPHDIVYK